MLTTPALADPQTRPGAAVVLFDGQCRFCRGQVERLAKWDLKGRLSYLSLHDPRVASTYPSLRHEQLMEQMFIITPDGDAFGGADAVRFLTRYLPNLWWLAPLTHVPFTRPLQQWVYQQVAKRRYQIAGRQCDDDACSIHAR
jgi:predicted DCC family thiol-disulfide oxidoreductase YuxK